MSRKFIYIGLAIVTAYFVKKEIDKKNTEKQINLQKQKDVSNEKIEKIKVEIFHLIEAFHHKYKSDTMTDKDLSEYKKIINKIVE